MKASRCQETKHPFEQKFSCGLGDLARPASALVPCREVPCGYRWRVSVLHTYRASVTIEAAITARCGGCRLPSSQRVAANVLDSAPLGLFGCRMKRVSWKITTDRRLRDRKRAATFNPGPSKRLPLLSSRSVL